MTRWHSSLLFASAGTLLPAATGSDTPSDYSVRAQVTPVAGASIQRVELPGPVLAALRRADGGDLRLFDAQGRRVLIARVSGPPVSTRSVALTPLPIVGTASAVAVTGLSLRLDDRGGAPVARVDGAVRDDGRAEVIGALLDARGVAGAGRSVTVDVALPAGQPVTLDVEASPDLKTWRSVAEQVAYHTSAAPAAERLTLADASLAHDWLRITWRASTRLVSPVTVRNATLTVTPAGASTSPALTVRIPAPRDAHSFELALPFATRLAGMGIAPATDAIVPVRLFGRADAEQPWTLLGEGTAARASGIDRSGAIPLAGPTPRLLRIEADSRSDGFVGGAAVTLRFDPVGVVFASDGVPLTLAAGRAGRAGGVDRSLPLASLLPGGETAASALPEARLDGIAAAPPDLLPAPNGRPWRVIGLWSALLGATALLGWMAWRLARQQRTPAAAPPT